MAKDFFLRAESASALYAALGDAGVVVETEGGQTTASGYALDVIGPISKQVGGTAEEPVMQQLDGFHANLRGELSDAQIAMLPVIATPNNPVRVWF
jgi:hypothetical protein